MSPVATPRTIEVAGWTIHALREGTLRLDGGAMWGVVPKNIWAKLTPPAADNTIELATRPYLCVKGDRVLLIEAGVGDRWESKYKGIYHLDGGYLEQSLAWAGYAPEQVTDAVASHGHWDHIGGWVVDRGDGPVPLLPNARHWLEATEVERCLHPDHVRRGSYRPEDLQPLVDRDLVHTFEGTTEILPEVEVRPVGGHSDGVGPVIVGPRGGERAIFWADVVPTTHHVQPPYIMAYDIDVVRSFEVRKALLEEAARERWTGLFYHDTDVPFARVAQDGRRFVVEPV
ncbi:putative quorum-quenching lactonase YtnP [Planctomycetes bacterium Pla163]|uniref:Putative quorum-quenching lactonase YtnP n=1 Tax=Rohdeia mirabilis TaxID=2528008 RepID=A0A518CYC7_9BACT|nr:putative quorum-quenching lactonase YtnP [Planctomycetes bacterium Pla163]